MRPYFIGESMNKKIINMIKQSYNSVRIARIHPNGVIAVRLLVIGIITPIILVIAQYLMAFISGVVDDNQSKMIDTGIKIIDHIYVPSVLAAVTGFLMLWLDKDSNGIPDKLEQPNEVNKPPIMSERMKDDDKRI